MSDEAIKLRRSLSLPLLVLYGTGVTIGAGIYVLIGPVAGHSGIHSPLAFLLAAVVMGLTVASYAELCTRFPVAAGEAAYVKGAFQSRPLSIFTGLVMILTAVVASAAVAVGATGYIGQFVDWPQQVVLILIVVTLGIVSAWGILESVLLASVFTLVEIGGLLAIIAAAFYAGVPFSEPLLTIPPMQAATWAGIAFASLLAFFAFIGFEDLTNIVEEAHAPERNIPLAMVFTLIITTLLYVTIAAIAVTAVPPSQLSTSLAPLSLVYREVTGVSPAVISVIAIVATLNTILAQMTMATRVIYGMAQQGDLPRALGRVYRATATPIVATAVIAGTVLALALLLPLERLAEWTSLTTLVVFALVNAALLKLRWRSEAAKTGQISIPIWVPVLGLLSCLAMILGAMFWANTIL